MNAIEISQDTFMQHQSKYLALVQQGIKVVVNFGAQLIQLKPVKHSPKYHNLSQDTLEEIDESYRQIERGDCVTVTTPEELENFLNGL